MSAARFERRRQRGQAMAEFLVCCLFLFPLFIAVLLIGRYQDIDADAASAGRYVAWERSVWSENEKSRNALRKEIDDRYFDGQRAVRGNIRNIFDTPRSANLVTAVDLRQKNAKPLPDSGFDPQKMIGEFAALVDPRQAIDKVNTFASDFGDAVKDHEDCFKMERILLSIPVVGPPLLRLLYPVPCAVSLGYAVGMQQFEGNLRRYALPLMSVNPFAGDDPLQPLLKFQQEFSAPAFAAFELITNLPAQVPIVGSFFKRPCPFDDYVLGGVPGSDSSFFKYAPGGLAKTMKLDANGLYGVDAVASARQLVGPSRADIDYSGTAAILTDNWTPETDKQYAQRVERAVGFERYYLARATLPVQYFANIGVTIPDLLPAPFPTFFDGFHIAPFGNGCNAMYVEAPVQSEIVPWSLGGVFVSDLVGDAITYGALIKGETPEPPPMFIQHDKDKKDKK